MALKDIFTMIKADRYTADGCEEIKKAQKAITEETADAGLPDGTMRHRKDGDYIKQAGKWVPAKKGNGGAKKADKPEAGKPASAPSLSKAERQDAMAKQRFDSVKEGDQVTAYGSKVKIVKKYPGSNSIDVEFKDSKGEKQISHLSILDIDDDSFTKKGTESKPAEKKPALKLPDEKSSFATDVNRMKKLKKEDYKQYTIQLEKLHSKYPINKWKDLYNKTLNDAAPRELTGDCKIRIRNSK